MLEMKLHKLTPTLGSLFAGIGGIDLGFERAGFKTAWQVEIDPYCRKVLAKHFPDAERFEDVREVGAHNLCPVEVIAGGFPCQDISNAGRQAGITGERSGLWKEYARIIGELRPHFVLVENVAALLGRGIDVVCGDLAEIGYDAEWKIISAADVGAPHLRERVWLLAYPGRERVYERRWDSDASEEVRDIWRTQGDELPRKRELQAQVLADTLSGRQPRPWKSYHSSDSQKDSERETGQAFDVRFGAEWPVEPGVGRVAYGIPSRMDRLRGLGNSVVPKIPEMIAQRIMEYL
jgi:DNA (cytosine-5)-methyltransferase 1